MSFGERSPWRGCAASFHQPVTEEDRRAAQYMVESVHYFNCFVMHPTLPRIVYRSGRRNHDILTPVYRWDTTPYEEVFENGFCCRREEDTPVDVYFSLEHYIHNGGMPLTHNRFTTHAFVSTTLDPNWEPLPNRPVVYRYEIFAPGGINVAATLGQYYFYPEQDEVAFVGGIAPQYIRSAQRFRLTGTRRDRRWEREDYSLVINEHINPQAHPFMALPIQNPVVDYCTENGGREHLNIRYHPATDRKKRSTDDPAEWYAVDVAETESYINAAFKSSSENEAYIFMKNEYVLVNYAPGKKEDEVKWGPIFICDGFPSLKGTPFGEYGIDCAFRSYKGEDEAFIFSGNICARINYAPGEKTDEVIEGPLAIVAMFPFLKGTVFESGIDAAFESTVKYEAYLFRDDQSARINYEGSGSISIRPIKERFHRLGGTIFENGFDAAFGSYMFNEAYLFKGDSYALINFSPATSEDRIIGDSDKKIKTNWPNLGKLLPRKNHGLDVHGHRDQ